MPNQSLTIPFRSLGVGQPPRPYLVLVVTGLDGRFQPLVGLVDTGADTTSFPFAFAGLLGYDTTTLSPPRDFGHAGGVGSSYSALVPCTAAVPQVPNRTFELNLQFVDGGQFFLWGRSDFMAAFDVTIRQSRLEFSLEWEEPSVA